MHIPARYEADSWESNTNYLSSLKETQHLASASRKKCLGPGYRS